MFTRASFVTHSARATEQQLAKADLLPKIRFKILLTPELSTIFRGKPDELAERFSVITRVLDGQGLTTDSGTHGQRGYTGDYLFAWIGCTTPFNDSVWEVMAQLGSRLFFLVMDAGAASTVDDMVKAHSEPQSYKDKLTFCQKEVSQFVEQLFIRFGDVRGVAWNAQDDPREILERIAQCATLLAVLRTPIPKNANTPPQPESPLRANAVLYNLARGHALVYGRTCLDKDDLPMIARITLSSVAAERQAVLLAFVKHKGDPLTVEHVREATGVSRHTAEGVMEMMAWLGIAVYERPGEGRASLLTLKPEWAWIAQGEFAALLLEGAPGKNPGMSA